MTTYAGLPCKHGHDGTRSIRTRACVECMRQHRANYRNAHPERVLERRAANREKMRVYRAAWYRANSEKVRAQSAAYQKANPEKRHARRAANREQLRAFEAARYRARRDSVLLRKAAEYAANPEKHRADSLAWAKANPVACVVRVARRRAAIQNAPGRGVTIAQWRKCLTESLGICAYCNERKPLTMDHVEPVARGGAHDVGNIVAACGSCNPSKGNRQLVVWLALRAALRAA